MQPVIYDVAVSADGYIAGPAGDITAFAQDGPVVDDYLARLAGYACAIMGRHTYEFGYRYGLVPGANPYPSMTSLVISREIALPREAAVEIVRADPLDRIDRLRREAKGPIYLCGGGRLAGWLLERGRIDLLRLKRAPALLGSGTRLFGESTRAVTVAPVSSRLYDSGVLFQEFRLS